MQDPLDVNLTTLESSREKILNPDRMELQIKAVEIKATSKNDGRFIAIQLATLRPQIDQKGGTVDPGFSLFTQVMLNVTGNATAAMVRDNLIELVQAARLTGDIRPTNADMWYKQLEGKTVFARVDFEPESTGKDGKHYGARNSVGRFLKP